MVRLSKSTPSPDDQTCSVRSKQRNKYQRYYCETNNITKPFKYTLPRMIDIFHDKQQQIESQLKKVIENGQKQESREHLEERLWHVK